MKLPKDRGAVINRLARINGVLAKHANPKAQVYRTGMVAQMERERAALLDDNPDLRTPAEQLALLERVAATAAAVVAGAKAKANEARQLRTALLKAHPELAPAKKTKKPAKKKESAHG